MPLAVCWAAETVERKRRRVDLAESRGREAVLHLLMTGQLSIAHQVAGALKPTLRPVPGLRGAVPGGRRDEVARVCAEICGGRSWIVRCPVYARHLILIVPAGPDGADPRLGLDVAAVVDDCVVGVSEDVPLSDTATGYRQAFHALAVARGLPARHARFGSAPEPALVVGEAGAQWADTLLAPLLTHLPRRSQDPGSQELAATLSSWLAFSSHATQHLKIHRNTLAARLRLIGGLLGLDLNRVADQAALDLAPHAHECRARRPARGARTGRRAGRDPAASCRRAVGGRAAAPARRDRYGGRDHPAYLAEVRGSTRTDRSRVGHLPYRAYANASPGSKPYFNARCSKPPAHGTTCGWHSTRWTSQAAPARREVRRLVERRRVSRSSCT